MDEKAVGLNQHVELVDYSAVRQESVCWEKTDRRFSAFYTNQTFEDYEAERLIQIFDTYSFGCFEVMGYEIFVDNEYLESALRKFPGKCAVKYFVDYYSFFEYNKKSYYSLI